MKGATSSALLRFPGAQYFNPRSREGSDGTAPSCRATGRNFNPRSREGSDALQSLHQGVPWISIHAPVKGATTYVAGISNSKTISIHAPVKGATRYFNELTAEKRKISIHAPVKGATSFLRGGWLVSAHFNPRSREGSDIMTGGVCKHVSKISIHAPVKGATPTRCEWPRRRPNFNPRSREGSDVGRWKG